MTLLQGVIQGLIQGFTEFLPVSSSGHLSIYQYLTGQSSEQAALFSVVLHLGTLIAVVIAFWKDILPLIAEVFMSLGDIFTGQLDTKYPNNNQRTILLLVVALVPLLIPFFLQDFFRSVSSDNSVILEGVCLMITGVLLFAADKTVKGRMNASNMTINCAIIIGVMQAIAPLPGISRSGSTLAIALILGLSMEYALSFSFILGIPAVCAALLLDLKDILGGALGIETSVLVAGLVTSAVTGLLAISMVRWIARTRKLKIFAFYTLFAGAVVLFIGVYDHFTNYAIQQYITSFLS